MAYPNQHTNTKIPHESRYPIIVPDTVKITFNLNIEPSEKTCSIVSNVRRAQAKKMCQCLDQRKLIRLIT